MQFQIMLLFVATDLKQNTNWFFPRAMSKRPNIPQFMFRHVKALYNGRENRRYHRRVASTPLVFVSRL